LTRNGKHSKGSSTYQHIPGKDYQEKKTGFYRGLGLTAGKLISSLIEIPGSILNRLLDFLDQAADRNMYDFFFRRSVVASIFLIISLNLALDILLSKAPETEEFDPTLPEVRSISPRTLIVVNAVPRTTLAQKRVKVPKIQEVPFPIEEIEVPEPKLGAIEIGPETPVAEGPTGPGTEAGPATYRRPELVMLVPPVYPKDAEKKRIEGSVELRILVTENGTVDQVEVVTSSGLPSMDEAAIKAAKKTRFRPGIKNGRRVAMWIHYPIQFALSNKEKR